MGKCKPQQTDAGSEPDERAGQTDKAKDARDGAGQAEKGQWDTQGRTQAPVQLEGPPEGSRGAQKLRRDGGTTEGSCRAQPGENAGHRGTSGEDEKARAGPGRDGAGQKGERMRWRARG